MEKKKNKFFELRPIGRTGEEFVPATRVRAWVNRNSKKYGRESVEAVVAKIINLELADPCFNQISRCLVGVRFLILPLKEGEDCVIIESGERRGWCRVEEKLEGHIPAPSGRYLIPR